METYTLNREVAVDGDYDVQVHGSIRVQPACDLDVSQLIQTLRQTGTYLPQTSEGRTAMSRSG